MLRLRMMADQVARVPIDAGSPCDDAGRACAPFRYRVPVLGWLKPMGLNADERRRLYDALRADRRWFANQLGPASTTGAFLLVLVLFDQLSYLIASGNTLGVKLLQPAFGIPLAALLIFAGWRWVPPINLHCSGMRYWL